MRQTLALLLFATIIVATTAAQSGRKVLKPPPTQIEPAIQPPTSSETVRMPPLRKELTALPESLLNRQIKSIDKGSFSFADFSGKVIVVNIWASWCGPCRMEVPDYEKVRKEYAGRSVEFIGLTTEDPRSSSDRVNKFVRDLNFGFRLGWADRETARILMNGKGAIPQTLVIATDGRVLSHWTGYSRGGSRDHLRQIIDSALP